jgi:hypothetical protein
MDLRPRPQRRVVRLTARQFEKFEKFLNVGPKSRARYVPHPVCSCPNCLTPCFRCLLALFTVTSYFHCQAVGLLA